MKANPMQMAEVRDLQEFLIARLLLLPSIFIRTLKSKTHLYFALEQMEVVNFET